MIMVGWGTTRELWTSGLSPAPGRSLLVKVFVRQMMAKHLMASLTTHYARGAAAIDTAEGIMRCFEDLIPTASLRCKKGILTICLRGNDIQMYTL